MNELVVGHHLADTDEGSEDFGVVAEARLVKRLLELFRAEAVNEPLGKLRVLLESRAPYLGIDLCVLRPSVSDVIDLLHLRFVVHRYCRVFPFQQLLGGLVRESFLLCVGRNLLDGRGVQQGAFGELQFVLLRYYRGRGFHLRFCRGHNYRRVSRRGYWWCYYWFIARSGGRLRGVNYRVCHCSFPPWFEMKKGRTNVPCGTSIRPECFSSE